MTIPIQTLFQYFSMGFKLVPLDELSKNPTIHWSEIHDNFNFWSEQRLKEQSDIFQNVSTTFGKSRIRDLEGRDLYLYCLDLDSEEALRRVSGLLEGEWKSKTFVTK